MPGQPNRCLCTAVVVALSLLVAAATPASDDFTTFILVRHAEKVPDGSDDPLLTPAGEARARALAALLEDSEVDALFSSPYRRTERTLQPLSELLGLPITTVPAKDYDALIEAALAHDVVVVSGHSNTIPAIVEKITGRRFTISEDEHDNVFIVTRYKNGRATVTRLRFDVSNWK